MLNEAKLAKQRLAQLPPTVDDLGGVHAIVPTMTPEELEACRLYHLLLVACFDIAISLRERIEEPADWEKTQSQKSFEEFGTLCWATVDTQYRETVPGVYFNIMLPHVHSLMKLLKQKKQIKPKKENRFMHHGTSWNTEPRDCRRSRSMT